MNLEPRVSATTERLRLRKPTPGDARAVFEGWAQDPEVTRYMTWRPHESIQNTHDFLAATIDHWNRGSRFTWFLVPVGAEQAIGAIGYVPDRFKADIGFVLARAHWRQGLMTEAARWLVGWLLAQPPIHRVGAVCDVDNAASRGLLERLPMRCEGILRRWIIHPNVSESPRDCYCFSRGRGER